ncbi:MAG: hypothetical protein QM674_10495 [Burkholderiaceae bacterium]
MQPVTRSTPPGARAAAAASIFAGWMISGSAPAAASTRADLGSLLLLRR